MFTMETYFALMQLLLDKGYSFCFFIENLQGKRVYLRHDLDFCIDKGLQMARKEAEKGYFATYFVMVDTLAYNPFERSSLNKLQELVRLGHKIGLHYVVREGQNHVSMIQSQCSFLESMIDLPVRVFSLHRPATLNQKGFDVHALEVEGFKNVYHAEFFQVGCYLSDSNHNWRCGDPVETISQYNGEMLQLLTHPIWWTAKEKSPLEKIDEFIRLSTDQAYNYAKENVSFLKN